MIIANAVIVLALLILLSTGGLWTGINSRTTSIAQASTDEQGDEGSEEESNDSESNDDGDSDPPMRADPGCGSGDCEAGPAEDLDDGNGGGGSDNDNDDNGPLPYCDDVDSGSCHDLDDVDEETGKYPCNDGTQRTNKEDCPDVTKPILPTQPNIGSSRTVTYTTYSIQGSGLPEQTGPLPVPILDQAVLKIMYDDEWSGNILDSNMTSQSYDGDGNYSIVFPSEEDDDGFFSLTVQKSDDDNEALQLIVQNY